MWDYICSRMRPTATVASHLPSCEHFHVGNVNVDFREWATSVNMKPSVCHVPTVGRHFNPILLVDDILLHAQGKNLPATPNFSMPLTHVDKAKLLVFFFQIEHQCLCRRRRRSTLACAWQCIIQVKKLMNKEHLVAFRKYFVLFIVPFVLLVF